LATQRSTFALISGQPAWFDQEYEKSYGTTLASGALTENSYHAKSCLIVIRAYANNLGLTAEKPNVCTFTLSGPGSLQSTSCHEVVFS